MQQDLASANEAAAVICFFILHEFCFCTKPGLYQRSKKEWKCSEKFLFRVVCFASIDRRELPDGSYKNDQKR